MTLGDLPTIAITFVIVGVVVAVGLAITTDVGDTLGDDECAGYWNSSSNVCQVSESNSSTLSGNSFAFNATQDTLEGTAELSDKLPLIGLVVAFGVLLAILADFMFGIFRG